MAGAAAASGGRRSRPRTHPRASAARRALVLAIAMGVSKGGVDSHDELQCRFETDPETGEIDLSPMIAMLRERARNVQQIDEIYKSGCVPIAMMADGAGRSVTASREPGPAKDRP